MARGERCQPSAAVPMVTDGRARRGARAAATDTPSVIDTGDPGA